MSKFDEFVKAYNGTATDYDGAYGAQCVDLAKLYLCKVFSIKPGSWGDAKRYFEMFDNPEWGGYKPMQAAFIKIKNSRTFIPQKGDICIWNGNISKTNNCGHIAIATGEGDTKCFYSYDQNWGAKYMHKVKHSYNAFYGVLRPKNQSLITGKSTLATHIVNCSSLNVRSGASVTHKVVKVLKKGQYVAVKSINNGWAQIGLNQYASAKYLTEVEK